MPPGAPFDDAGAGVITAGVIAGGVTAEVAPASFAARRRSRSSSNAASPRAVDGAEAIRAGSGRCSWSASQRAGSAGNGSVPRRPSPNRTKACAACMSIVGWCPDPATNVARASAGIRDPRLVCFDRLRSERRHAGQPGSRAGPHHAPGARDRV